MTDDDKNKQEPYIGPFQMPITLGHYEPKGLYNPTSKKMHIKVEITNRINNGQATYSECSHDLKSRGSKWLGWETSTLGNNTITKGFRVVEWSEI